MTEMYAITGGKRSQRATSFSVNGIPTSCKEGVELKSSSGPKNGYCH